MKNLTDSELLALAYKNLAKADKQFYSIAVLTIIGIIQSILLIFNFVGIVSFLIIYPICFLLYFYHRKKHEEYLKIIDELLKELASREI
jgi:hypothetical protein